MCNTIRMSGYLYSKVFIIQTYAGLLSLVAVMICIVKEKAHHKAFSNTVVAVQITAG